jgi:hypothetical protein
MKAYVALSTEKVLTKVTVATSGEIRRAADSENRQHLSRKIAAAVLRPQFRRTPRLLTRCICPVGRGAFRPSSLLLLVGLFLSEDQPLGCEFAIKTLIFRVRHPQRPFHTLGRLRSKILRMRLESRRLHRNSPFLGRSTKGRSALARGGGATSSARHA